MIYLDNAATSYYRPPEVCRAVALAMETMGNSARGTHEAALTAGRTVYAAREAVNELFGGDGPEQTVFTANATQSLNTAIKGILRPGDLAVATVMEHNSVLRPLYEMEKQGVRLKLAGCDRDGRLKLEELYGMLTGPDKPRLVISTHASNLTGNINDIAGIGGLCRREGVLFLVDASQTAGIFPIHMKKMGIDVLCFTGHKSLMGPQGTGGLCVRKGVGIRPLVTGGSGIETFSRTHPAHMPAALEAGTLNSHGIAGLLAGINWILEQGPGRLREKEQGLAWAFYQRVKNIPGIIVYGDFSGQDRAPIVALNIRDADSGQVSDYLAEEYGIFTRPGGHCAPLMHEALGAAEQGAVRFSFSHFNTMEDVDTAVRALEEMTR